MKRILIFILTAASVLSCYKLQVNQKFDTTGNWYSKFSMAEYLESEQNEFRIFAEAAKRSGLMDEIAGNQGKTYLVPTDEAFIGFLNNAGIESVADISPSVLKAFLQYLELPSVFKSTDFAVDENIPVVSASGYPVYLTRKLTSANKYRLYVNTYYPSYVRKLGGPAASVTMQDLLFKDDNMIQVVDAVPYYAPVVESPEVFIGSLETDKKLRLNTNIDTYIYNHAGFATPQSSKAICSNSERVPIVWYESKDITFQDKIASASVYFYRSSSSSEGTVDTDFTLHDISDQIWSLTSQGADESALLNAVIATFLPSNTIDNTIATFSPAATANTWFSIDITSFMQQYYAKAKEDRIPLAFSMSPVIPFKTSVGLLPLGWKNNTTGSVANNPSYIEIIGLVESRTVLVCNNPLDCPHGGSAVIDASHLSRKAADNAGILNLVERNITYSLSSYPEHGTLTVNGIPLTIGKIFNQSQINAGVVRYFSEDSSNEDSFSIHCGDYTGSSVPEDIVFKVNMR